MIQQQYNLHPEHPERRFELPPVMFAFLVLGVVFLAYQILGGLITYLLFGFSPDAEHIQGMRLVTMISQVVFLLLPAIWLLRLQDWSIPEVMRIRSVHPGVVILVVVSVIALQFTMQAYIEIQQHVLKHYLLPDALLKLLESFEELIEDLYRKLLVMRSPGEFLFVWLVVALTPAVCEEVLFRGTVQTAFERGMRTSWALLATGVIFALFHLNPVMFVPLAILGTYFSVLTWRSGSIITAVIGHVTNNTIAIISLYFLGNDALLPEAAAGELPLAEILAGGAGGALVFTVCVVLIWRLTASGDRPDQQ